MMNPKAEEARRLYAVMTGKEVASKLGVSRTTVMRWVNPKYNELVLRLSREAKRRRTGTCSRCGGETRYNGHTKVQLAENGASLICAACAATPTHCGRGHEYTAQTRLTPRGGAGWSCRICRNDYMREYSRRRRRAEGRPARDLAMYESRRLKLESEGAEPS